MIVNGREIRITHPDKVLYLDKGYTKRDLIDYYLAVQDVLLTHNAGRPVVFIRYPHGTPGYSFFQKNVPSGAPSWIHTYEMGKFKKVNYLILHDIADLIWLVQLHALEFHIINIREPRFDRPDLMVFDIDPPEGQGFTCAKQFAIQARPYLEEMGYKPFVKTSGKRGVHICCPIKPEYTVEQVMAAAKKAAEYLVSKIMGTTLEVRKDKRGDRLLIDIYRNRPFQTFSMPYGTRRTPEASVSMPLTWKMLHETESPARYNIRTVPEILKMTGDPWKGMEDRATPLF